MITLGLDIGSNSVGSAWVDTENNDICVGVSVFPAGVDETDTQRGDPIGKARRLKRLQRRNLARRSKRKRLLREVLTNAGLLPKDPDELEHVLQANPWHLRCRALQESLTPHEFGRVLLHLGQRRGAVGIEIDPDDPEDGKVKAAIDRCNELMKERKAATFGQLMAALMDERKARHKPIRNRKYRLNEDDHLHADRETIRSEFLKLWLKQKEFGGALGAILTDDLKRRLDNSEEDKTWRYKGAIFGQRRTYWNLGTLGRCDLEPTDRRVPIADMYAQEYRVIETVNNIRIEEQGRSPRPLSQEQRERVIAALRREKAGSVTTVRKALGINTKAMKNLIRLNIERDADREINTDWFYREFVHGVFGEDRWQQMSSQQRDSVNAAILKFDPNTPGHSKELVAGAMKWWKCDESQAQKLVEAWKSRPKLDKRLRLSRRAVQKLIPYMNQFDSLNQRWPTQEEARQRFAEDASNNATSQERERYALGFSPLSKADRHYLLKHPDSLPPAPMLPNPVVRKAIHEVRRHIMAYLRKFGRKPDRIVIEYARSAKQSGKVRQAILDLNREREKVRKKIIDDYALSALSLNQQRAAVDRVILCRQQRGVCPYSGSTITERQAADGTDLELDHIVPASWGGEDGLNNRVLCYRNANQGKGSQTPRLWLPKKEFEELENRLRHLEKVKGRKKPKGTNTGKSGDYFTAKDCARKWANLHRTERPTDDEWANSQLTDAAYAARLVGGYLQSALYGNASDGARRIFTTKGKYTAMLRRDWQLFQTLKGPDADESMAQQQQTLGEKNRGDHRHHAVDAVVIALTTPAIIKQVASEAAFAEEHRERTRHWPKRKQFGPPWGTVQEFREQVISRVFGSSTKSPDGTGTGGLIVSHRAVKRKLVGHLHKEQLWGSVDEQRGIYRIRCEVADLTPKMLRSPVRETDSQVKKRLFSQFKADGMNDTDARRKEREIFKSGRFERQLTDPPLGKGGLVRDWNLRKIIRDCLTNNGINPDDFTKNQIVELARLGKLRMPPPGEVPIKSVITIGPISDPVKIKVRDPSTGRQVVKSGSGEPVFRYHISRNNHHVEIREDAKTGDWVGNCVTTYEATRRVRPPKDENGRRQPSRAAVDRTDHDGAKFIMSLCEGEVIHARRPDREPDDPTAVNYYVVAKIFADRVWFSPHFDARTAEEQERWDVTLGALKNCGPEPGKPPYKVRIGPLGDVTPIPND